MAKRVQEEVEGRGTARMRRTIAGERRISKGGNRRIRRSKNRGGGAG